jgi:hypothetical protein
MWAPESLTKKMGSVSLKQSQPLQEFFFDRRERGFRVHASLRGRQAPQDGVGVGASL